NARLVERLDRLQRAIDPEGEFVGQRWIEGVDERADQALGLDLVLDRELRPDVRRQHEIEITLVLFVAVNAARIEGRLLRDVPVHAQNLFAARLIDRALKNVVVVVRDQRRVEVGQREDAEQLLPGRVNAVGRDYVQTRRVAGRRARGITEAGRLIVDAWR